MRNLSRLTILGLLILAFAPGLLWGQSVGTVTGQVTDQSGAVVPGAQVVLTDAATKTLQGQPTNAVGRFVFVDVKPGTYDVTVTAKGFRKLSVPGQQVVIAQSLTLNLTLEVGAATQTVEVTAVAGAELQTLNSTMGSTLAGDTIIALPNVNRDATSLMLFQPNTAPTFGGAEGNITGGQVAGAMSDQSTFRLDGGNATSDMEGDNGYVSGQRQYVGPQASITTPIESIQEFQVQTNNMTADFAGASGAQIVMVTKRGQDAWHGSGYEYFQSDVLNAAGWDLNINNNPKVKIHQNRFGGAVGGPMTPHVWGGKTYFYFNYEGRRYPNSGVGEWTVPSATMRDGVLQFADHAGNIVQYNLATSTQCGAKGGLPCDPRGIGLNPVVNQLWQKYVPLANDCVNSGDHLNTCGFRGPYSLAVKEDNFIGRIDHDFGSKWHAYTTYRYYRDINPNTSQIDIGGLAPGDKLGVPASQASTPLQPRYFTVALTGTLRPTLTNEFNVSFLRNDWEWKRAGVIDQISGIPAGLEFGENHNYVPMNMDTQSSRFRIWDGHDLNISDNLSWLRGNHLFQFGGYDYHQWMHHARNDQVVSGLAQLVYQLSGGTGLYMTDSYQPPVCPSTSGDTTANCIPSGKLSASASGNNWNALYANMLGTVGTAAQLFVRGGSNFSLTNSKILQDTDIVDNYSLYFNDSWKIRPNLTLNYGLEWGVQMPPYEINGVQDYAVDASGAPFTSAQYFGNRVSNALQGMNYNPELGFSPIRGVGGSPKYPFDPFYGGFSPRVSLAYSPTWDSGIVGKLFGHKSTVIRGGYARIYDRSNGVDLVLTPLLGYGFAQDIYCSGAGINGACNGARSVNPSGSLTPNPNAGNTIGAFRIGVDGNTAPFPTPSPTLPVPVIPGINSPAGGNMSFLDHSWRPGSNDQIDFSIQRQFPDNTILEVGYVGRWAKHLYQGRDLNDVPWMMTVGGQSFANAFDNLYYADTAGKAAAPQPFFESALGGPKSNYCSGYASCTAAVQANEGSAGTQNVYFDSVYSIWSDLDHSFTFGPALPNSIQGMNALQADDTSGWSNYQALTASVSKRAGHDLMLNSNFTYSKSLNTIGINQEYTQANPTDPFNLRADYGPSPWDRRLVLNILGTYGLPFGKGKLLASQYAAVNKIIGGWSFAPIFTWATGAPIETYTGSCQEWGQGNTAWCAGAVPLTNITGKFGNTLHGAVQTDCTVGVNNDPHCASGGGNGGNMFANPTAVFNSYRPDLVGVDGRAYDYGPIHGQHRWNLDFTIAKSTMLYKERVGVSFYAQFINALNHMMYNDPYLDVYDAADFGTLTGQYGNPRTIELGARVSF
ncbi:MAG TPA: carboxypeptidase-like regulatory domain-containing protein [Terriglobia bacterium]|nr:carboxypeptidase-like regulatory domain-containing protein [Terriglobia bacterium]